MGHREEICLHSGGGYTKEVADRFENVLLDLYGVRQEIVRYVDRKDLKKRTSMMQQVPGHMGEGHMGIGHMGTGHMGTGTYGYQDTRVPGHMGTRTHGYRDIWVPGHMDTRTHGYWVIWVQ